MTKTHSASIEKTLASGPDQVTDPPYKATLDLTRPDPATMTGAEQSRYEALTGERIQKPVSSKPVEEPAPAKAAPASAPAPAKATVKKK